MDAISQLIKDISRAGRIFREERLLPLGLSSRAGMYLHEICAEPGITQEQLTQRIGINKSNVARQVAALEEEGYIERRVCGQDKRRLRLYPTPKALEKLPHIEAVLEQWDTCLRSDLTEEEKSQLQAMLTRMRTSAMAGQKEEKP